MSYVVETTDLSKQYGALYAVNQVSLAVLEGSVYGFIGPNGAGKSTTMKMLLGLVKPSGGEICVLGQNMNGRNQLELLHQIGSLIESPSCYGHLTGEENLQIVADLKDVPRKDIDRVLEIVDLTSSRKRKVKKYSLGMRQRLGIAQALLGNPKLLILDEPTNGLDPAGIQEMRSLISEMPKKCKTTVLISSHLLSEVEQMVDQVGIINHGKLLFQGPLPALKQHSQGDISLRVLNPEKAIRVLEHYDVTRQTETIFCLPSMQEEQLALLVQRLAAAQAGVVEVKYHTRSLEEIFLSLTGEGNETEGETNEMGVGKWNGRGQVE